MTNSLIGHNNPPPEETGPYAIYRTAKIKTEANLAGSSNHMTRSVDTPNADPDRAHLNRVVIGSDDPQADVLRLLPKVGERDPKTGKMLRRSNSVLAIEVLLTASPEWWRTATDTQKADWERRSVEWLQNEYGVENVVHLRIHGDERTPHLTGYIVPIDPQHGGLNCRRWIGERQQLRDQQTAYAEAVEHLGLQRGVPGSTAIHEAVRRAYGALSGPETPVAVPAPPHLVISPEAWATEATAQMTRDLAPTIARAKNADAARTKAKSSNAQAAKDRGRADRAEAVLDEAKKVANQMRALPLEDVLEALGFDQDKNDKLKWKSEGFAISVGDGAKSGKWFDHVSNKGRGGAIDLVCHVMGTDFKGSVAWLADRFGPVAAAADVTAQYRKRAVADVKAAINERPAFTPPSPAPDFWPQVRRHLVNDRALPAAYIDKLHERGDLYADARRNAVFLCRDEAGQPTGAELKGTVLRDDGSRFNGMAAGSKKDAGGFRIGNIAKATAVYLVESAIDAISLMKLRTMQGDRHISVVSTAGITPEPRTWFAKLSETARRICAFDNDTAGDESAKKLRRHKFERLRPVGKDWNDDLKAARDQSQTGGREKNPQDPFASVNPDRGPSSFEL